MLEQMASALERALAVLLAMLLAAIVLAVTWQVVSRYLLGDPSGWTEELARFLLIWIGLFGAALACRRRLHLGIDLLPDYLRRRAGNAERSNNPMTGTAVLVFAVAVLIVGGSALVALTFELRQVSPALGLPMGVVYLCLPGSGLAMAAFAVAAIAARADGAAGRRGHR